MIESFFQLSSMPFSRDIPVEHLWHSGPRNELHCRLMHIAKHKSFGVFTGDAGSGKTTAIRRFVAELDKNHYQVLYISDSALTPRSFYWEALHQLGQVPRFYRGDAQRQLHKTLRELREQDGKPLSWWWTKPIFFPEKCWKRFGFSLMRAWTRSAISA